MDLLFAVRCLLEAPAPAVSAEWCALLTLRRNSPPNVRRRTDIRLFAGHLGVDVLFYVA
jgi:hypothetical protein